MSRPGRTVIKRWQSCQRVVEGRWEKWVALRIEIGKRGAIFRVAKCLSALIEWQVEYTITAAKKKANFQPSRVARATDYDAELHSKICNDFDGNATEWLSALGATDANGKL